MKALRHAAGETLLPLLLGLLLRLWFVHRDPVLSGDPLIYGTIAHNLLQHGVYGLSPDTPTLIRLPGYPLFLAACFSIFGIEHYFPILYLQVAIDLLGCILLSCLAARLAPPTYRKRAARVTLWLAALCPFTACYTAAPLTETLELFSITAALFCFTRALGIGEPSPNPHPHEKPQQVAGIKQVSGTHPVLSPENTLENAPQNFSSPNPLPLTTQGVILSAAEGSAVTSRLISHIARLQVSMRAWTNAVTHRLNRSNKANQAILSAAEDSAVTFHPTLHTGWLAAATLAWITAALLRPDGALLGVVLCPALVIYSMRGNKPSTPHQNFTRRAFKLATATALASLLAFLPWTLRNWHTLHTFQPLAPRYATDPGEPTNPGFQRWTKTICADLVCTIEVYWAADDDRIATGNLPNRAFDSATQLRATADLLADYNRNTTITPALDTRFNALARQRIAAHPLRYYLELPLLRLADMWFRPRIELFAIDPRWWRYRSEGPDTILAWTFAALNVAYLALALAGAWKRPPLLDVFSAFILLRCALLLTIEAPEPRYTLECFPMIFVLAGLALSRALRGNMQPEPRPSCIKAGSS